MHWLEERFELSRGGESHNVRPMEGLRGFAVFLVFWVHYVSLVDPWLPSGTALYTLAGSLHTIGNTGVDLFFVLSGYLIYGTLIAREQPWGSFMARRIRRIYPAFTTMFVVYVGLSFVFSAENKIPSGTVSGAVYLLENFLLLPGLFPITPMITVAWSLSYEMFFYLAIPLVISAVRLRSRSAQWRAVFFLGATFAICMVYIGWGGHIRLVMFIAGILLYEALAWPSKPASSSAWGLAALVGALLVSLAPLHGSIGAVLKALALFSGFFWLCFTCFQQPLNGLARTFSWTPLRWLGNMSYSYYLIHGLALKGGFLVLSKVLPPVPQGAWFFWVLMLVMFALTLVPSALLFLLVERRFSLAPTRSRPATDQSVTASCA